MSEPVQLRRLLPEPGTVTADQAAAHLTGRQVLLLNMVASADGHITLDGRSGGIQGGPGDRALFHALRAHADAILVGTGTLRAERYGDWIRDEHHAAMRRAAGLGPPVGATLTRRGVVPWEIPLFAASTARVIIYTGMELEVPPEVTADVEVVTLDDPSPAHVVADLRARGVRSILCEGGPTLNAGLLRAGAVDELTLVLAPQLVGGGSAPLTVLRGEIGAEVTLEPLDAYEAQGALLLRYRVARGL